MEQADRQYLRGVMTYSLILMAVITPILFLVNPHMGMSYLIGVILSLLNISLLIYTIRQILFQEGKRPFLFVLISMGKLGVLGGILYVVFSPPTIIQNYFKVDALGLLLGISVPFMMLLAKGSTYYRSLMADSLSKE